MKQLTITITALVTDCAIDEEINPIIDDSTHSANTISGHGALKIVYKLDNKYAEIQHAEFAITDAQIGEKRRDSRK